MVRGFLKRIFNAYENLLRRVFSGYDEANKFTKNSFFCVFISLILLGMSAFFMLTLLLLFAWANLSSQWTSDFWYRAAIYIFMVPCFCILLLIPFVSLIGAILAIVGFFSERKKEKKKLILPLSAEVLNLLFFLLSVSVWAVVLHPLYLL